MEQFTLGWVPGRAAHSPGGHGHVGNRFGWRRKAEAPASRRFSFDKFHVMRHLGEVLIMFARASRRGPGRPGPALHQGQKYTVAVPQGGNLTLDGKKASKALLSDQAQHCLCPEGR